MRDTEAEYKAPGGHRAGTFVDGVHGHGIAGVDAGDTGGEDQLFTMGSEMGDDAEGVAPHHFGKLQ